MRKALLAAATALALVGAYGCASDCDNACDKLKECFSDTPELVADTCVEDCEAHLDDKSLADDTQKCLDCLNDNECSAILPTDGSDPACVETCGYRAEG